MTQLHSVNGMETARTNQKSQRILRDAEDKGCAFRGLGIFAHVWQRVFRQRQEGMEIIGLDDLRGFPGSKGVRKALRTCYAIMEYGGGGPRS